MTPYYQDDAVTIYHGDCREIAPTLDFDVIVTDPPYGINARDKQHAASSGPVLTWDAEYPHDVINALAASRPVVAFGAAQTIARELAAFDPIPAREGNQRCHCRHRPEEEEVRQREPALRDARLR